LPGTLVAAAAALSAVVACEDGHRGPKRPGRHWEHPVKEPRGGARRPEHRERPASHPGQHRDHPAGHGPRRTSTATDEETPHPRHPVDAGADAREPDGGGEVFTP
jgi:hypothetical protein